MFASLSIIANYHLPLSGALALQGGSMQESIKKHKFVIGQTLIVVVYSWAIAMFTQDGGDLTKIIALIFSIILIGLLNLTFFRTLRNFLSKKHSSREMFGEFGVVAFTGISNILLFAGIYFALGISDGSPEILKYKVLDSLYFSIVTWTTLGYGDFKPIESLRILAALQAFMGYVYMAIFVGIFLNISTNTSEK